MTFQNPRSTFWDPSLMWNTVTLDKLATRKHETLNLPNWRDPATTTTNKWQHNTWTRTYLKPCSTCPASVWYRSDWRSTL